jgi:hypothetical protein
MPLGQTSRRSFQPGAIFFFLYRARRPFHLAFQLDAFAARPLAADIWPPTAVQTFFQGPGE